MIIETGTAQPSKEKDSTAMMPQKLVEVTNAWFSSEISRVSSDLEERTRNYADGLYKEIDQSLEVRIQNATKEFRQQIDIAKTSTLQTLGLFVALFTFVSVNITIFAKIEYLSAGLWFMFLMMVALITFVFTLNIIINARTMSLPKMIINIVFAILIGSVIPILIYLTMNNPKLNPLINYIKYNKSIESVVSRDPNSS